ncbi:hypothetical protein RFI_37277, partial [Reticulomyxa filosa]
SKEDKWVNISYPQQITCDDVDKLYKTEWISSIKMYVSQSKAQNNTCNIFKGNFIRGVTLQTNYLRKFSCLTFGIADRANYITYFITPPNICYALTFVGFPGNGYLYGLQTTWENVCDVDQKEALSQAENFQVQIYKYVYVYEYTYMYTCLYIYFYLFVGDLITTSIMVAQFVCGSQLSILIQALIEEIGEGCNLLSAFMGVGYLLGLDKVTTKSKEKAQVGLITYCYESGIFYENYPTTDTFKEFIQMNGASAD